MKMIWKNISTRVWFLVTSILLVLLLVVNLVATQNLMIKNTISTVLGGETRVLVGGDPSQYQFFTGDYSIKDDALLAANLFNEKIVEEGIVLLKNKDNALPLSKGNKVSVFGKNSNNLVFGGSGSGGANSAGSVSIYNSLLSAGFEVNPTLKNFYSNEKSSGKGRPSNPSMGMIPMGLATGETPQSSYSQDIIDSYSSYNDAALVVFSRIGGEGFDLPRTMMDNKGNTIVGAESSNSHYLQLDKNEKDLLVAVKSKFKKVIVIINSSASMELGFLADDGISGALWIGSPGKTGINALGRVLNGSVNPSGRLVDTYATDFKKVPSWNNFSNNQVSNGNRYNVNGSQKIAFFVEYEEGIYVGYRYYETRGEVDGENWYSKNVVYPFGYGLSYTDFNWEVIDKPSTEVALAKDGKITVQVKVTNIGNKPGKDVVQMYYTAPYKNGEIEKAHVVLADFAKTGMIDVGKSEIVSLTLNVSDMASYDYGDANANKFCGYELDAGAYKIKISKNAHTPVHVLNYRVEENFRYDVDQTTGNVVGNLFDDVSGHIKKYMSRSDFDGTWPTMPIDADRAVTQEFIDSLNYSVDDNGKPWYTNKMPTQAKAELSFSDTKVKLYQLIGKDYDDPLWDKLLNQLTVKQMAKMIGTGNFNTMNIDNISKPKTIDPDGPAGFTNFMGDPTVYDTCFYASECVIGATWNKELAFDMGEMIGNEGLVGDKRRDSRPYSGWYAPAVNIHRSPFSGRNWEYYSEDGVLSGKIGAQVCQGAKSKGVYTYVKHFALNDQETNRDSYGLLTWANEQAMRELYFKPFEIIVKQGKTTAMMSSFNRIGKVWAGGSYELLTKLLRNEWGFKGTVITDYNVYEHMPADQMIRAGGDLNLFQDKQPSSIKPSATQVSCIRQSAKNILYTVSQSNAMNGMGDGVQYKYNMPLWMILLFVADSAIIVALGVWGFFVIKKVVKKEKAEIQPKNIGDENEL